MGSARFQHAVRGILAANFCPPEGLSKNNSILLTKYQAFARYGAAGAKKSNPESFRGRDRISFVSFVCFVGTNFQELIHESNPWFVFPRRYVTPFVKNVT